MNTVDSMRIGQTLFKTPYKIGCAITGGGAEFISELTRWGGSSNNFVYGEVPYHQNATEQLIGHRPVKYGSFATAISLRTAIDKKLYSILTPEELGNRICIGVSSVLYKSGQREGRQNHSFLSFNVVTNGIHNAFETEIEFARAARSIQEECICDYIFFILAKIIGDKFEFDFHPSLEKIVANNQSGSLKEFIVNQ